MIAANDPNIIYLLQRYAEESGFQTAKTSRDTDVLPLAQQVKPALSIVDINLPGTMGGEVLHCLKTDPVTRSIPVVVYSCLDESLDDWGEGVAGYLRKSVMYDEFVTVLERAGALL